MKFNTRTTKARATMRQETRKKTCRQAHDPRVLTYHFSESGQGRKAFTNLLDVRKGGR